MCSSWIVGFYSCLVDSSSQMLFLPQHTKKYVSSAAEALNITLLPLLLPLHVFSFQSQLIHLSHNPLGDAVEKQPCWKLLPHQMTIFPLLALQVVQPPVLSSRLNSLSPSHIITVKTVPWCLTFYS